MSVRTCVKRRIEAFYNAIELKNLGCNMLFAKKAEITVTGTDIVPDLKRFCIYDENAFYVSTS